MLSPITSYADQIASIHRSKTSDGFSLDIPLIMLMASILKYDFHDDLASEPHATDDHVTESSTGSEPTTVFRCSRRRSS